MNSKHDRYLLMLLRSGLPAAAETAAYAQRSLLQHLLTASVTTLSSLDRSSIQEAVRGTYSADTGLFSSDVGLGPTIIMLHCTLQVLYRIGSLEVALTSWIDGRKIAKFISQCQRSEGTWRGGFSAFPNSRECDLRCTFSALFCIDLLRQHNIFCEYDASSAEQFVKHCFLAHEGAFGGTPTDTEAHCGMTFCGVAALRLLNCSDTLRHLQRKITRYCTARQNSNPWEAEGDGEYNDGLQGRPNKPCDTCYTFWVCGTLSLLRDAALSYCIDGQQLRLFVDSCSDQSGIAKTDEHEPDPVHTALANCGVCIISGEFDPLWMRYRKHDDDSTLMTEC